MPNLCYNRLRVSGPAEDAARFRKQAVGFCPWGRPVTGEPPDVLNLHSLVPVPQEVLAAGYKAAGRDWESQHWGCHLGVRHAAVVDEWEGGVLYEFYTAWTPAVTFVEHVSLAWPTLVFILDYEEPCGGYKGLARAHAGNLEDHCIEL